MFVMEMRRFLRKKILGMSTGKVGNLDVKNTTVAQQCIIYWMLLVNWAC